MDKPVRVLVVDDEEAIRRNFQSCLEDAGYEVVATADGQAAMEFFERGRPDVILTDLRMGRMSGLELLSAVHAASPDTPVIVVSGTGTVRDAVAAMRSGAWDYILKPIQDDGELEVIIQRALERARLLRENRLYRERLEELVVARTAELGRRNRELALLNRIMAATSGEQEPKAVLEITCRELAEAFDLPQASALLLNEEKTKLVIVAEHSSNKRSSALHACIPLPASHPLVQTLIGQKRPLVIEDAVNDPRLEEIREIIRRRQARSFLVLPLVIEDHMGGCLVIGSPVPRSFTNEEIDLAQNVAQQAARSLALARLSETRRRLLAAIEQTPGSVLITDLTGNILYVNPAFEQITGFSRAETIGKNARILKSGQHSPAFYQELWTTIGGGQVWQGVLINRKKNGLLFAEDTVIAPVRDGQGTITNYIAVKRDITEQRKLEAQILRMQRVESVGRLANGVAHDLNNVLTPILMAADLLAPKLKTAETQDYVELISASAKRGGDIVKQLLLYSRGSEGKRVELDLRGLVRETTRIIRETFPKSIQVDLHFPEQLWAVEGDPTQLHQVILNLCVNARDAMPEGGILEIGAEDFDFEEAFPPTRTELKPGPYVVLKVTDTGNGIPADIVDKIYDPFFTTKEPGQGTGLGLSTVLGIVKSHGGLIEVQSRVGQGTQFLVYLPAKKSQAGTGNEPAVESVPKGAGEWILVVDDEEPICRTARRVLQAHGFQVVTAANGFEALAIYAQRRQEIAAVVLDMWMPFMNGPATIRELEKLNPGVRILAVSGLPEMKEQAKAAGASVKAFLLKPWTPAQLLAGVAQLG